MCLPEANAMQTSYIFYKKKDEHYSTVHRFVDCHWTYYKCIKMHVHNSIRSPYKMFKHNCLSWLLSCTFWSPCLIWRVNPSWWCVEMKVSLSEGPMRSSSRQRCCPRWCFLSEGQFWTSGIWDGKSIAVLHCVSGICQYHSATNWAALPKSIISLSILQKSLASSLYELLRLTMPLGSAVKWSPLVREKNLASPCQILHHCPWLGLPLQCHQQILSVCIPWGVPVFRMREDVSNY